MRVTRPSFLNDRLLLNPVCQARMRLKDDHHFTRSDARSRVTVASMTEQSLMSESGWRIAPVQRCHQTFMRRGLIVCRRAGRGHPRRGSPSRMLTHHCLAYATSRAGLRSRAGDALSSALHVEQTRLGREAFSMQQREVIFLPY
jgi:hypothetical protein